MIKWDEKAKHKYKGNTEEENHEEEENREEETVQGLWQKIKKWVHRAMIKNKIKIKRRRLGYKNWWDRNCTKKKREVKNWYRKWRVGGTTKERYLIAKKEMKELQIRNQ